MKQAPNPGRRRFTAEERANYVELFHRSGMTRQAFAEANGFHAITLGQWLRQARANSKAPRKSPTTFKELPLPACPLGWSAEIALGAGVSVRLRGAATTELLTQLVNRLGPAC